MRRAIIACIAIFGSILVGDVAAAGEHRGGGAGGGAGGEHRGGGGSMRGGYDSAGGFGVRREFIGGGAVPVPVPVNVGYDGGYGGYGGYDGYGYDGGLGYDGYGGYGGYSDYGGYGGYPVPVPVPLGGVDVGVGIGRPLIRPEVAVGVVPTRVVRSALLFRRLLACCRPKHHRITLSLLLFATRRWPPSCLIRSNALVE
jgi:hypothetical protein